MEEGVLTLNNTGQGNNYVASSTQSGAFVFETTMSYQEGATADAGLLFGAPAQEMEPAAGGWYGAMVNNGEARVFCERGRIPLTWWPLSLTAACWIMKTSG